MHTYPTCCRIKITLTFDVYLSLALFPFPPWVRRTAPGQSISTGTSAARALPACLRGCWEHLTLPCTALHFWVLDITTTRGWGGGMGGGQSRVIVYFSEPFLDSHTFSSSFSCSAGSSCTSRATLGFAGRESEGGIYMLADLHFLFVLTPLSASRPRGSRQQAACGALPQGVWCALGFGLPDPARVAASRFATTACALTAAPVRPGGGSTPQTVDGLVRRSCRRSRGGT